jgi:hypothetical protein
MKNEKFFFDDLKTRGTLFVYELGTIQIIYCSLCDTPLVSSQ